MGITITKYAQNGYNLSLPYGRIESHVIAVGLSFIGFSFDARPATQPVQRILQAEVGSMRISHGTLISYFSAVSRAA